ncbi:hypothetical protein DEJ44_04895 [Streptomyces venezuelae]|nr:hypothetical protein DEJ44_04895 [Streptomyces venezuelae]
MLCSDVVRRATSAVLENAIALFEKGIDDADPPPVVRHHQDVHHIMRVRGSESSLRRFQVEKPGPFRHGSAVYVWGRRAWCVARC